MDTSTRGTRPSTLEYKRSMSINYGSQNMDISHSQAVGYPSSADEIAGMLLKRRGGFGKHMPNSWQLRYFTIRDGVMMYFEGDNSSHPRGRIDLRALHCTFQLGLVFENAPTPFTLQIAPGGGEEKWKLCAENPEDLERWSMCIEKHVNDKNRREANLHIGSDDECILEEGDLEPRRRKPPNDTSALNAATTGLHAPTKCSHITAHNDNTQSKLDFPSASSTVNKSRGSGKRRGLKLKSETVTPPETIELITTVVILNICITMLKFSDQFVYCLLYVLIANVVVIRTLRLRANRFSLAACVSKPAGAPSSVNAEDTGRILQGV